jgi:hypothetical protein
VLLAVTKSMGFRGRPAITLPAEEDGVRFHFFRGHAHQEPRGVSVTPGCGRHLVARRRAGSGAKSRSRWLVEGPA